MDPVAALETVATVINTLAKVWPEVVAAGANLKTFGVTLYQEFTGTPISAADQASLEARIDQLSAQLQAPLPDAQPGDPDYVAPPTVPDPPAAT